VRPAVAGASGPAGIASELVLVGAILAAAGVLFAQGLDIPAAYDEGSYLAAVDALRHGQALGKDVFTPEPPAFYTMLGAGDAVLGGSLKAIRSEVIALALLGCLGAYLVGRLLAGRAAGLGAATLLAVAHPYPAFAGRISADLPALVVGLFALAAFLAACRWRSGPQGDVLAIAAGALFALSVLMKLSLLTLAVAVVGYAVATALPLRRIAVFIWAATAVVVGFVLAYRSGLDGIWHGAVSYHTAARDVSGPGTSTGDNFRHYQHFFDPRTRNPLVWIFPLGLLAWVALPPRRRLPFWPLWGWGFVAFVVLVWHRPLGDSHDVLLAGTLGVAAGIAVGLALAVLPLRQALVGTGLIAAVLAIGYVKQFNDLHRAHGPEPAEVRWAADQLRARTGPDDLVATDRPIVAVLADRRMPGNLVDTAALRFRSGSLSPREVLEEIDRSGVRAVAALRAFSDQPAIVAGLRQRFGKRIRFRGTTLYINPVRPPTLYG
jgi:hypothetical protein